MRPRDLALLLLASGDLLPRQRARDQQADRAGLDLKRRILDRLAVLDPEPAELEAALFRIVEEIGPPAGPTRAVAAVVRDEWLAACSSPEWVLQLLGEATSAEERETKRGRRLPR
ncbi:MAG TPA: hypothetical protein VKA46_14525 [Gemmataceae bacterium]|nr:hypothetical protein [Gemmataceae bacterium]